MLFGLLFKGFLMGFSIAMPVGPIGLLCIRNTLNLGFYGGLVSGLGAACVDALLGFIAGLGISAFSFFLEKYALAFHAIGSCFLFIIGIAVLLDSPRVVQSREESGRVFKKLSYAFFSTFFLTLVNPITILSYAAIYAAIATDLLQEPGIRSALTVAAGVFIGALLWWLILAAITAILKKKMELKHMKWINILSGSFIICLGIGTLLAFLL